MKVSTNFHSMEIENCELKINYNNMLKKFILFIYIISQLLIIQKVVLASEPTDIVFTEIMYDIPGSDEDYEWVEIFNKGNEPLTIITGSGANSWRFNDGSNHLLNLFQGSETIEPQSFAIIADDGQTFLINYPDFIGTIFQSSMSLANSSDTISLSVDNGQTFFSQVSYENSWGAVGNGMTLEKIDLFGGEEPENWQESYIIGGTPGQVSSTPPPNQPPLANAGEDQTNNFGQITFFDGSLSTDPDGDELSYFWDFGDNNSDIGVTTTHQYLATGTYQVILTVTDGELEDSDELIVNVIENQNQPPIANAGPDQTGQVNQTITFSGSNSYDPDNDPLFYTWNFGDNQNSNGMIVNHNYQNSGNYLVTLYVSDGVVTSTDTLIVVINQNLPPNTGGSSEDYSAILINELLPNPQGSDDSEWIELYNNSQLTINLNGLKIQDNSSTVYSINIDDFLTTQIYSYNYFVIERAVSGIALNNTGGDCVKLLSSANILIKQICYSETAVENKSYARKSDNSWSWTEILTKGSQNQFININQPNFDDELVTSTTFLINQDQLIDYNSLIISEFLPDPIGSDTGEFIEIYNQSTSTINLLNWQLDDQVGGSSPYKIIEPVIIAPAQYLVFYQNETNISLNNTNDTVRLIAPTSLIIQNINYQNPPTGQSSNYNFLTQQWYWAEPTPGLLNNQNENQIENTFITANLTAEEQLEEYLFSTITQAKELVKGSKVKIHGIVTALPGTFSKNYFYVSEINFENQEIFLENGIQIYSYKKDFPDLKLGDVIEIKGEISETQYEKRIKTTSQQDIIILDNLSLPAAFLISISEIGEEVAGGLVKVSGEILDKQKNTIILADESGEIKVYFKNLSNDFNQLKEGYLIEVSGIISETKNGFRLMPRLGSDWQIGEIITGQNGDNQLSLTTEQKMIARLPNNIKKYLTFGLIFLIIIGLIILIKYKFIKTSKIKISS